VFEITKLDEMQLRDWVLFYHSNSDEVGIAGLARVCRLAYPDSAQFDPKSEYYDSKSTKEDPRWCMVDIEFVERFTDVVPLSDLRANAALEGMALLQRGQRLSVQPVSRAHLAVILKMAGAHARL